MSTNTGLIAALPVFILLSPALLFVPPKLAAIGLAFQVKLNLAAGGRRGRWLVLKLLDTPVTELLKREGCACGLPDSRQQAAAGNR